MFVAIIALPVFKSRQHLRLIDLLFSGRQEDLHSSHILVVPELWHLTLPGPQILHLSSDGLGLALPPLTDQGLGLLVLGPDDQTCASVPLNYTGLCLSLGNFDNFLLI